MLRNRRIRPGRPRGLMRTKCLLLLVFWATALAADWVPADDVGLLRLEKSADAMGSTYSIALYGNDRVAMEAAADAAFDEVQSARRHAFELQAR